MLFRSSLVALRISLLDDEKAQTQEKTQPRISNSNINYSPTMLIKEYRICMPLTVEEYRIAQLYMIQKKSREESTGAGSGVEILKNEPYENGPGGQGQFTFKIYHVGSHLPAWFRNILPSSALRVEEEAWNAYPYTKTRYKVPFVEKFTLEIETLYEDDAGEQANVFQLTPEELRERQVDFLDMVVDNIPSSDYRLEEDPKKYVSTKTGRGPLTDDWREMHKSSQLKLGNASGQRIMCAYKLCRVEFRYWGMQSKLERFIHDVALRKTMLRAHRQAWCWQDEWHGLTMEDIRALERETALKLARRMAEALGKNPDEVVQQWKMDEERNQKQPHSSSGSTETDRQTQSAMQSSLSSDDLRHPNVLSSDSSSLQMNWNIQSLENLQRDSSDEENFYDAEDVPDSDTFSYMTCRSGFSTLRRSTSVDGGGGQESADHNANASTSAMISLKSFLVLVVHGGSLLDTSHEYHNKNVDVCNFRNTVESVLRSHYPHMMGRLVVRLVACPPIVTDTLKTIASLSPFAFEMQGHLESVLARDFIPLGAIPLFFSSSINYQTSLEIVCSRLNNRYSEFLRSDEGLNFNGSVCVVADSAGSILMYDILCKLKQQPAQPSTVCLSSSGPSSSSNGSSFNSSSFQLDFAVSDLFMLGSPIALVVAFRQSMTSIASASMDGAQLSTELIQMKPQCGQVYNLFHLTDPCSFRVEPLLYASFRHVAPIHVWRYSRFELPEECSSVEVTNKPHGHYLMDAIRQHSVLHNASAALGEGTTATTTSARTSSSNASSGGSPSAQGHWTQQMDLLQKIWWGDRRVDYGVHSPDALKAFPIKALPHLLHSSYWESMDAAAFILRQLIGAVPVSPLVDNADSHHLRPSVIHESADFDPDVNLSVSLNSSTSTTGKGLSLRNRLRQQKNSFKFKTASPNHRANDVIVLSDAPQELCARFIYGPLDVMPLSGESVDVYIMTQPPNGCWEWFGQEVTDSAGRVKFHVPEQRRLTAGGLYPVRMMLQSGDRSNVDLTLAVLHPHTDVVVFSVDGSFAASVSIMGKDPKVRPCGVDVARHWQNLGFLLIYVSARPAMQHRRVVHWMAQHHFPHGMCLFSESLNTEPLRKKASQLQRLVTNAKLRVHCGYGSAKDIAMYRDYLKLPPERIFVLGTRRKSANKNNSHASSHNQVATHLYEGYAMHLNHLRTSSLLSRPAQIGVRTSQRSATIQLTPIGRRAAAGSSSSDSQSLNESTLTEIPLDGSACSSSLKSSFRNQFFKS